MLLEPRTSPQISRRSLLAGTAVALASVAVVACGSASPAPVATTAPAAAPTKGAGAAPTAAPTVAAKPTTAAQPTAAASTSTGSLTISFWSSLMGSKEAARAGLAKDFEAANPGMKIQHEGFFDIMQNNEKLLTAMVAGNPPDVVSNHYYFVSNYANANALVPLDPLMAQSKMADDLFVPSILQLGQWKGKTYALPIYADTMAYFYNVDLYTKAGLDPEKPAATWNDMIADAKKMTVRQGGKLVQEGMSVPQDASEDLSNMFYAMLLAGGGSFLSGDGKTAAFNDASGQQALQTMVDLVHTDKVTDIGFGQGLSGAATPFYDNKTGSRYDIPPTIFNISKYAPKLNYAISPLPAGPKGQATPVLAFEMFIPKGSKNQDNAWKFIAFAMTPPEQVKFNKTSNHLACEPEALKSDPFFTTNKYVKPFYESLIGFSKPFPITPAYADILATLQQQLQAAVLAKSDVKTSLDTAASYANDQLSKV